ncbi:MAG: hypothetical protein IPK60_00570 [Sandaracinaceae bacterium]|nr:hypothetical protein [Sandaracinaceae bacterium]
MSSEELQRRVSTALDAPGGIDADAELKAAVEADPELQSFVADAKTLDGILREWPLDEISDEAWEAMAARVDQRLDDALAAIGDVTRPPVFDDGDARRDPSGQTAVQGAQKSSFSIERLNELESTEELSIPHLPPPPPSNVIPLTSPKPSRKDERLEIPTVKPLLQPLQPLGPLSLPPAKSSKSGWIVGGGLAAAAAILVVFGWQLTKRGDVASDNTVATTQSDAPDYERSPADLPAYDRADRNSGNAAPAVTPAAESPRFGAGEGARAPTGATTAATTAAQEDAPPSPASGEALAGDELGGMLDSRTAGINAADDAVGAPADQAPADRAPADRAPADRDGLELRGRAAAGGGAAMPTDSAPTAPAAVAPPAPAARRAAQGPSESSADTTERPRAAASRAATAREEGQNDSAARSTPEQSEVRAALESVRSAVTACAAGQHGQANIRVTFNGASGRVSTVNVEGVFAGTPQGSCMARAVRAARVSRFSDPTLVVLYPYAL